MVQQGDSHPARSHKNIARMLKMDLDKLLHYFEYKSGNTGSEGVNSKVQPVNSNAWGFRSLERFKARVLFYCSSLDMGS